MEATTTFGIPLRPTQAGVKLPKIKSPKKSTATALSAVVREDRTPLIVPLSVGAEYTDAQFAADISKASKKLDKMEAAALKEHAKGKTREFPV